MAGFSAAGLLDGLFGGDSVLMQLVLWQGFGQVIGSALAPYLTQLQGDVWSKDGHQTMPLPPAMLADMALRGVMGEADAAGKAARSGVPSDDFHSMVLNTGEPLPLQQLFEAWRRGIIGKDAQGAGTVSLYQGIKESRLRNEWGPVLEELQWQLLPVSDLVDAVVENQHVDGDPHTIAQQQGIRPADFDTLVATRGNPPSPTQLVTLYRRGLIPLDGVGTDALSVHQGIAEGATKDKWWRHVADLATYIPPPRTIVALLKAGAIAEADATTYLRDAGLDDKLLHYYLAGASQEKVAKHKELAEGQILDLYQAKAITQDAAAGFLQKLGYTPQEVAFILSLRDVERELKAVNAAVSRVHNLYVTRKLSTTDASGALDALGIDAQARDDMLVIWQLERGANVKVLTQAEITAAYKAQLMDQTEAMAALEALGYAPYDAWVLLSLKNGSPLPDQPEQGKTLTDQAL